MRTSRLVLLSAAAVVFSPCVLSLPQPAVSPLLTASRGVMSLRGGAIKLPFTGRKMTPPAKAAVVEAPIRGSVPLLVRHLAIVVAMTLVTIFSRPTTLTPVGGSPSIQHVFHYGWVTALTTGLGVLPLLFMGKV